MRPLAGCVLLLFAVSVFSQTTPSAPRPRIGLALEGGGAFGLAHLGVLRWMEEHRIPVDYVAGTSMGGLIGGAYATGMRADELQKFMAEIDWDAVLRDQTAFRDLAFRRKQDRRAFPSALEFGLRHGLGMPAGLNSGQQVNRVLDRIALPYSALNNFDELPIPFRCVATDLMARQQHVFQDGQLADALRATMAMPGIFAPAKIGGRLYVDGGLFDDLPSDVARQMGAEIVIGIHLEVPPLRADEPVSPFTVLVESFRAVTVATERRGIEQADLVVAVDMAGYQNTDYALRDELAAKGYATAQQNAQALLKYAVDEATWQQYLAGREARRLKRIPTITAVAVEAAAVRPGEASAIANRLTSPKGEPVDAAKIEQEVAELAGTGRFSSVRYHLRPAGDAYALQITAAAKDYAPPLVTPTLIVDGSDYKNVRFGVGARLTLLDAGKPGAELRADVLAGSTYAFGSEYFRPLLNSAHWFTASWIQTENAPVNVYSRSTRVADYRRTQATGGFDLGYQFSRFSEVRVGYEYGWLKYYLDLGDATALQPFSGKQGVSRFQYALDRRDDAVLPRKGFALQTDFGWYARRPGAGEHFPKLETMLQFFQPVRRPDSVYFSAAAGSTFGFDQTGLPLFTLGGVSRLASYGTNEIFTNQYALFQAGYLHELGQLPPMAGGKVYLLSSFELGKSYGTPWVSKLPLEGTAGVVVQTLLGPAYVGGSWGDSGHRKFFFQLGRIF